MRTLAPLWRGCAAAFLVCLFCAAGKGDAEPKSRKPRTQEPDAPAGVAQFRIWKDAFAADRPVRVSFRVGKKPAADVRLNEGRQFLDYQEIATGPLVVEVIDEAEGKPKLAATNLAVDGGDFFTILISEVAGRVAVDVIDDAVAPAVTVGELSVRNFAPGLDSLRVKIGEDFNVKLDGPAAFARVRGLAPRTVQIDTSGAESGGKQFNWANEIDFKKIPRATLLIVPDAYGRIRPRIVADGQIPAAPLVPAAH